MFEAVLFDNDGILIDTERLFARACQEVIQEMFGWQLTLDLYQRWGYITGKGTQGWLASRRISKDTISEYRIRRDQRYEDFLRYPIESMVGVQKLLDFLSEKEIPRAVVTATYRKHLELAHTQTGLLSLFKFTITNEDIKQSKPAPNGYLLAAEKLGVLPEKCLVLEDSPRGIAAGKAAGMTVWAVPSEQTKELDLSVADEIFGSLEEVLIQLKLKYHL